MLRLATLLALSALLLAPLSAQARRHTPDPSIPQHHGQRPGYLPPRKDKPAAPVKQAPEKKHRRHR